MQRMNSRKKPGRKAFWPKSWSLRFQRHSASKVGIGMMCWMFTVPWAFLKFIS